MPIMWALLVGSRRFRQGSAYMLAFFAPLIVYIPCVYLLGKWSRQIYLGWYGNLMYVNTGFWPQWMQTVGIIGLFGFPLVYIAACREWERPE